MKRFTKIAVWLAGAGALLTAVPAFAGDQIRLEDLPPAAKAAVEHETKGGKIKGIETDKEKGQLVYEVEYTKDGMKWETKISPTGAVIERHKD